jgi:hypothetical protein
MLRYLSVFYNSCLAALKEGLDLETIKEITGLDMNRLLELQKSLPQ